MVPKKIIHLLCYILMVLPWTKAEVFTALTEMEPLLDIQKRIIDDLSVYINLEEQRLVFLKKYLNQFKIEQEKAMEDIPNYLGNPLNAYTLIKRLATLNPQFIEHSINISAEFFKYLTIYHKDVNYPTVKDLAGAANALVRLQETYNLNATDMANGMLNGIVYGSPMTTGDCFDLARALYTAGDYANALPWFMETQRKYKQDEMNYFSLGDVLEYISFIHYLLHDTRSALEWTYKLLEIEPDHPRVHGNIPYYQKILKEEAANRMKPEEGNTLEEEVSQEAIKEDIKQYKHLETEYERLCRGEMELPASYTKNLYCRYLTENHPFLKLARIKMEYVYRDPDVIVFHEVLYDDEIHAIQEKAKPMLERAMVQDPRSGPVESEYRVSKLAWLKDKESRVVAGVSRRVAHMTGLSLASAEDLQVVNYGIGGHYEPHFDFAKNTVNAFGKIGNRFATVLFYMSEVAQGGATVFTRLDLSVFPIKGAALFWMNLHPSGQGDVSTKHGACPVLRGSKWVCNKWLHLSGQELLRPCGLRYQTEGWQRDLPRAQPKTQQ